tara:strand:- start:28 stop:150 length:123 start_codon:yes stop_codon:yes gene_type:complete
MCILTDENLLAESKKNPETLVSGEIHQSGEGDIIVLCSQK